MRQIENERERYEMLQNKFVEKCFLCLKRAWKIVFNKQNTFAHCCVQSGWHVLCSLRFSISEIPFKFVCGSRSRLYPNACAKCTCTQASCLLYCVVQYTYTTQARKNKMRKGKSRKWVNTMEPIQETGLKNARSWVKQNTSVRIKPRVGDSLVQHSLIENTRSEHTHAYFRMHTSQNLHVVHSGSTKTTTTEKKTHANIYSHTRSQRDKRRDIASNKTCNMQ